MVPDPLEAHALVAHPHVERPPVPQDGQPGVPEYAEAEVEGDVDDGRPEGPGEGEEVGGVPVGVLGVAADEPARVDVDDDGELVVGSDAGGSRDAQVQAVLADLGHLGEDGRDGRLGLRAGRARRRGIEHAPLGRDIWLRGREAAMA